MNLIPLADLLHFIDLHKSNVISARTNACINTLMRVPPQYRLYEVRIKSGISAQKIYDLLTRGTFTPLQFRIQSRSRLSFGLTLTRGAFVYGMTHIIDADNYQDFGLPEYYEFGTYLTASQVQALCDASAKIYVLHTVEELAADLLRLCDKVMLPLSNRNLNWKRIVTDFLILIDAQLVRRSWREQISELNKNRVYFMVTDHSWRHDSRVLLFFFDNKWETVSCDSLPFDRNISCASFAFAYIRKVLKRSVGIYF